MQPIADELRVYIARNRISQKALSQKTGISQSKLSMSLNGTRKLTADEFFKIVDVLGVSADVFIHPGLSLENVGA